MAKAKICDICGEFYRSYNEAHDAENTNGVMFINIDERGEYWANKAFDCCPACMGRIKSYIECMKKEKENGEC